MTASLHSWIPAICHAQSIEGWSAPVGFRAHLEQVANGSAAPESLISRSRDESLQAAALLQPRPKRFLRRMQSVPYEHPKFPVLRNLPGITADGPLRDFEAQASSIRMLAFLGNLRHSQGTMSRLGLITRPEQIYILHRYLFGDVYGWAGMERTVGIAKAGVQFACPDRMARHLDRATAALAEHRFGSSPEHLAAFLAEYLWAHPFRDGNGRTATTILMSLTGPLPIQTITADQWFDASAASLAARSEPDPEPWVPIVETLIQLQRQESIP